MRLAKDNKTMSKQVTSRALTWQTIKLPLPNEGLNKRPIIWASQQKAPVLALSGCQEERTRKNRKAGILFLAENQHKGSYCSPWARWSYQFVCHTAADSSLKIYQEVYLYAGADLCVKWVTQSILLCIKHPCLTSLFRNFLTFLVSESALQLCSLILQTA